MKQEFEMKQQNMDDIIAINKNQAPVMKFGSHWSGMDLREKINAYWKKLGDDMGFNHLSVEPSSRGKLFFLAEPKPVVVPKTALEKAMDEYDSLKKIVEQLESCDYKNEAGILNKNVAFLKLKQMAEKV